ncbi:nuclear transport factor 2 family protein [Ruegeria pomeroyi]|uniref:nuclear transport factor 2 family protein n=1 Tax=Ruegeria pomeroyi TaxID=89184 RepID=UPI001F1AA2F1|nr:nuclear transport factor 2 family protein [Ruegeria pomeroyi]
MLEPKRKKPFRAKPYCAAICLLSCVVVPVANAQELDARTPLEIVKGNYEERGKNLETLLAPDAKWTEAAGFPYAGTYVGFDDIVTNVFARLASEWTGFRFIPEGYVADDKRVVAFGKYEGTFNETGKNVSTRVAHVWLLEGGKVVEFEQIVDSVPVVEAMRD